MTNYRKRVGVAFAAAALALMTGANGLKAQDQAAMFADQDGLTPPDMGVAYEIPIQDVAATPPYPLWPELRAMLADPDGLDGPNTGFAYDIPVSPEQVSADVGTGHRPATVR